MTTIDARYEVTSVGGCRGVARRSAFEELVLKSAGVTQVAGFPLIHRRLIAGVAISTSLPWDLYE